mmetsp:Transcript_10465/g.14464  ORF Transcript_10465/g.14464 Transcript_10465/m.14464 type:complete len:106 (+) Transcript_10465:51-368(+)
MGLDDAKPRYQLPHSLRQYQLASHPPPPKTALAALFLLILGSILLFIGFAEGWYEHPNRTKGARFPLFMLGAMTFLPGSFATFMLFAAFRRWPGYYYEQVPSWDD